VAISLTPKQFDLLVALVISAGRLVEKDTLLKSVWPDVAVEEGNLTKGIFSLRQLLEQEGVRYIETVPKRGYRFAAAVTREASMAPALVTPLPTASANPPEPTPAVLENSIAVVPFTDMSAARDQEFFCEGMSEEIINALGRVPAVRVASYTSSLRFKGKAIDPQSIGRELMVSWLLEGSVRKSGEIVRIAVNWSARATASAPERPVRSTTRRHLHGPGRHRRHDRRDVDTARRQGYRTACHVHDVEHRGVFAVPRRPLSLEQTSR
jgi:DNA-binding winged helix-turn-helix (wHTH) protein